MITDIQKDSMPVGPLKIAALDGCQAFASEVNRYLVDFRHNTPLHNSKDFPLVGYCEDSYLISCACPRFVKGRASSMIPSAEPISTFWSMF